MRINRILYTVTWVVVAVLITANTILLIQSLDWPFILDAPFLHYIGWQITQGAVPYRDFFDMNLPGTYLLHAAVIRCLGTGDFAFRIFDIGFLTAISFFSFAFCKKYGLLKALLAAILFPAFHLLNGNLYCGQRDYLILVFIISALYFFVRYKNISSKRIPLFCSGFLIGAGTSIKPFTILWLVPLAVALATRPALSKKKRGLDTVLMLCGAAMPNILIFSWLYGTGGLKDFFHIYLSFGPLYAGSTLDPSFAAFFKPFLGIPLVWLILMTGGLILLQIGASQKVTIHQFFSLFGIAFGVFSFFVQGKGNFYHLYPAFFFIFLALALFTGNLNTKKNIFQIGLLFILLYMATGLAYHSAKNVFITPWQFITHPQYIVSLEKDLAAKIAPGEMIQFMEPDAAGTKIMLKMKLQQPTRLLTDGYLYNRIDHPYIKDLRREYIQDLKRLPPQYIVISKLGWPTSGYERLETFPALYSWLHEHYCLYVEKQKYRIYKRSE